MALLRKLFYRKPPDGLLEICERVYVFDSCFTTDAAQPQDYKGYVGRVITQVKEHYPDASILAFNFREGDTQSPIANALTEYDTTIMEYPRHYEGCPLLPMEVMHHFLRSGESWLSLGQQNLLFMYCEQGGWPVLACMLAALLIYRKHYSGELRTLDMVYKQAPREVLEMFSPLNPIPSQLRYLQYVSRRNVATEWPPLDRALNLDCVIIRTIPDFDKEGGCRPIFRIYGQDPVHASDRGPKVLFSTPKKGKSIRHYKQIECPLIKIDINCHIQGDVVMECIHLHDDTEREQMIFRVMFNTAFIRSNILILNRDEIDMLWDAKDQFPKDFRAEVLFSETDNGASVVPVDYFRFEEKDGLPVEAFGKVHEIFSGVDWLIPKGDTAVEALQQPYSDKSQMRQRAASPNDVDRKQSDPDHPNGIGTIIAPEQTLSQPGDHVLTSSALSPHQSSDSQSEVDTSKPKTIPSTPSSQSTKDAGVGLEQLLTPPSQDKILAQTGVCDIPFIPNEIPDTSSSPLKDGSSRSLDKSPETDASLDTAPHSPTHPPNLPVKASIMENSNFTSAPLPPPTAHLKENSTCGVGPSPPPSASSLDGGESPVLQPPQISSLKEHSDSKAAPLPPSTSPLQDNSVAKHAPSPPPPPPPPNRREKSSSSEKHPLPQHPSYYGQTPPSLPPPPSDPHLRHTPDSKPSHAPPPPPPPANVHDSNTSGSLSAPSAPPPPPVLSTASPSPPPPCPPPGLKGKNSLNRAAIGKNSQAKKLKPLHWLKISRAVSGSLWAETQKSGEAAKAPEIDMSELESLFSAAAPNTDQGRKTSSRAAMGQKSEKVQLIDHRRAYNCEIMLSKVKVPLHEMLNSVLALEESALDVDQVDNLIKFCPTKEEMEMLKGYKGEKDKLGKCEQFFLELMQVPRIEHKLRVFSFKIQFRSQVSDLRSSLNVVTSAADQIKSSAKLKRVMQTILSLGNALNQGTARGAAVGFRLDSLLKLTDTRARNNKMTLMHYLCKVLSDKLPELLDFWEDLSSLEPASKVQLKYLAEEMQAINKGLEKVVQELSMSENDGPVSENFQKALKEFLCFAESEVRSLASLYSGVGRNVDSLILYFGEDPARCPFEQVVTTLSNFVKTFKQAHEENLKQLEADKKKAEKEASEKLKINASDTGQEVEKRKVEKEGSETPKRNASADGRELEKKKSDKEGSETPKRNASAEGRELEKNKSGKEDSEREKNNASADGQALEKKKSEKEAPDKPKISASDTKPELEKKMSENEAPHRPKISTSNTVSELEKKKSEKEAPDKLKLSASNTTRELEKKKSVNEAPHTPKISASDTMSELEKKKSEKEAPDKLKLSASNTTRELEKKKSENEAPDKPRMSSSDATPDTEKKKSEKEAQNKPNISASNNTAELEKKKSENEGPNKPKISDSDTIPELEKKKVGKEVLDKPKINASDAAQLLKSSFRSIK